MSNAKYPKMPDPNDHSPPANEARTVLQTWAYVLHEKRGMTPLETARELGLRNEGAPSSWKNRKWRSVDHELAAKIMQEPAAVEAPPEVMVDPAAPRQTVLTPLPIPEAPSAAPEPSAAVQPPEAPPAPPQPPVAPQKGKAAAPLFAFRLTPDLVALGVGEQIDEMASTGGLEQAQVLRALVLLGLAQVKIHGKGLMLDARAALQQAIDSKK